MAEKKASERQEVTRLPAWRSPVFGDLGLFPRGWLMDDLFRDWLPAGRRQQAACVPAMDVSENDKHYAITVEVPGVAKDDVHVEVHEGMLTIRGEKKSEREEKDERRRYVERSYGAFSRSFSLPADADEDRVEASFKDGVLTVTIPKTAESKPQTVAIKGG
jgi:HSP20 family protein